VSGPHDPLDDLLGDDVPADERARLDQVDALLRSVPAPPPRPAGHDAAPPVVARPHRRGVRAAALAVAAVVAIALAVAAGSFLRSGDGLDATASVALRPTAAGPAAATGAVRLAAPDAHGNRALELRVRGLPPLASGYYQLGVRRPDGRMVLCGTFESGGDALRVRMTIPYAVSEDATWLVSARPRGVREDAATRLMVGRAS
jgi:hypothetical protein